MTVEIAEIQPIPEYDAEIPVDGDRMTRISKAVETMVRSDLEVQDLEKRLAAAKRKRDYFAEKVVPEIMGDVESFSTRSGFHVEVKDQVFASFPQEPERQLEAFKYIESVGDDGIIKHLYTIAYGRDCTQWTRLLERMIWPTREDEQRWGQMREFVGRMLAEHASGELAMVLQPLLDTQWTQAVPRHPRVAENASVDRRDTIHHSTLVKFIRDQLEGGKPIPLKAFGASLRRIAKVR